MKADSLTQPRVHCTSSTLKLLGDFWTLAIIDALASQELRFCEIERALPDINPVTLTNRLKKLEQTGLIERREETVDKLSVTYRLTKQGRGIMPILAAIQEFTDNDLEAK